MEEEQRAIMTDLTQGEAAKEENTNLNGRN